MTITQPLLNISLKEVESAYLQAAGKWIGCDWPTAFGERRLDLNGLKADQAVLLARATSGGERVNWRNAVNWLAQVERDAQAAEVEARTAVDLAAAGRLQEALQSSRRACAIEAQYHTCLVWQPLCAVLAASEASPVED
ncbi:MAG TPA: hypothetical protein VEL76_30445 [Gemmataceae bacterium]|nr:hypothetical protein [Gemmataceae bacterium]